MKNRLHFIPVSIIILTFFIIGSFLDLNISKNIANINNGFTKFCAMLATLPIALIYSFIAGNLIKMSFKRYKNNKMYQRILLIVFALFLFIAATLFFGINTSSHSYNFNKLLGVLVGLIVSTPLAILGYFINDKIDSPNLLKVMIFTSLVVGFSLACVEFIKIVVPRVRYIAVKELGDSYFRAWFDPSITSEMLAKVKELASLKGFKELHQSFPSGHSNFAFSSVFILMMLPIVINNKKLMQYQHLFFYGGVIYYLLIVFSRIYGGFHYLSDVSFSAIFSIMVYFIANEIYLRKIVPTFKIEENHANN